jgi:acyl dehydratase
LDVSFLPKEATMSALTHHAIHFPTPVAKGFHTFERLAGAVFFTVLAPVLFAVAIVSGLLLAMGVGRLL